MEVIGAGFGRTGTLSLKAALERLGYAPCYHMITEFARKPSHADFWREAVERAERGEETDWDRLLGGYGATVDWPGCVFYEELARAYPEAKVVLTVRDPERWYESARKTIGRRWEDPSRVDWPAFGLLRRLVSGFARQLAAVEAVMMRRTFGKTSFGDAVTRREAIGAFVGHNEEVRRRVPEGRLLVYEAKEGWGPLCEFLGVPEPDEPFPHENEQERFSRVFFSNLAVGVARAAAPAALAGTALVAAAALVLASLGRRRPQPDPQRPAREKPKSGRGWVRRR